MQVIYDESVLEQIQSRIDYAKVHKKTISKIILTDTEWFILCREMNEIGLVEDPSIPYSEGKGEFAGVRIEVEK